MSRYVASRLDNDMYVFTMGQVIEREWPTTQVEYALFNRTTDVKLAELVVPERVAEEIDRIKDMIFTAGEILFLKNTGLLREDYLATLWTQQLPVPEVSEKDGQLVVKLTGRWADAIFWETPLLAIITELYGEAVLKAQGRSELDYETALDHATRKIVKLQEIGTAQIMEFGSRRRFSRDWQARIAYSLSLMPDQLLGTSNVHLAKEIGLRPMGTMAHQMFMVRGALALRDHRERPLVYATDEVLSLWERYYTGKMRIALTDTWGTNFFLKYLTLRTGQDWYGMRQDSGDPAVVGEQILGWYKTMDIDPMEKALVFSDGLTIETIAELEQRFHGRIGTAYGWGTNLTNDVGIRPLSLVFKPVYASHDDGFWFSTIKLSDNIAKATGDQEAIAEYRKLSEYQERYNEGVIY